MEQRKGSFRLSDQPEELQIEWVLDTLQLTYWGSQRPRAVMRSAIANSICYGLYQGARQVGFARVVSDQATFAWLCDVVIALEQRGHGLGKWMVEAIVTDPRFHSCAFYLVTEDAHRLYERFGFVHREAMRRPRRFNW